MIIRIIFHLILALLFTQSAKADAPVWGVFHSIHTNLSDGAQSLNQRTSNLSAYYDFASVVDHDYQISGSEWDATINEVNANQGIANFLYLSGYEWLGEDANGAEVSAFFKSPPSSFVNGKDSNPNPNHDSFSEFATWLTSKEGIACVAHPARGDALVIWDDSGVRNTESYPCVEILNNQNYHWSSQWECATGSGCISYPNPKPPAVVNWSGAVRAALDQGLRLGFVAGWDYHGAYPGIPTAYIGLANAEGWTKEAVLKAVKSRHTWAAEDRIRMSVTSGSYIMGDGFVASDVNVPINYNISAVPGKTISQVNLFIDGKITQVYTFSGQESVSGVINISISGLKDYVFLEAIQNDGKRAWSSPMYIVAPVSCDNDIIWEGRVSASWDDAEEPPLSFDYVSLTSSDLELVYDEYWPGDQFVGTRFRQVDIPQGATILDAYIQFEVKAISSGLSSLTIQGEATDNAAIFRNSGGNISARKLTLANTLWSPPAWTAIGAAGLDQRTPDISSIVQEITSRPDWSRGNPMAFIMYGVGTRVAFSYDGKPSGAPLLHVKFRAACQGNPEPGISVLNPSSKGAGDPAFTLTVNGSGFVSGSVVRWNGTDRPTTVVSSTQLTAAIPAADIAAAGVAQVTVFNPLPGGGTSNALAFTISNTDNPVPTLTSLSPASELAGGSAFTLTVNGSGFVSGSVVRWNGTDRATTVLSPTQLTAAIPATDIALSGVAQVTLFNPTPGGGTSNAISFTIKNSMHIGDLDRSSIRASSNRWYAIVTIAAHDISHQPVQNVRVNGTWSGGTTGTGSCTTNISGLCRITSTRMNNSKLSVNFTATALTHSSLSYNSIANHDPDGDSTGTTIVITKPP